MNTIAIVKWTLHRTSTVCSSCPLLNFSVEFLCRILLGGGGHGAMSKKEKKGGEGETVSQRPYLPSLPPATLSVESESAGEIGAS